MFFSRRKLLEHGGLVALGSTGLAIGQPGPGFFAARAADNYLPTVADLRDLMPGRYDCVTVLGYHAPGDEGGGTFYWDAASGESDNGGTVLIPQRYSGLPPGARAAVELTLDAAKALQAALAKAIAEAEIEEAERLQMVEAVRKSGVEALAAAA